MAARVAPLSCGEARVVGPTRGGGSYGGGGSGARRQRTGPARMGGWPYPPYFFSVCCGRWGAGCEPGLTSRRPWPAPTTADGSRCDRTRATSQRRTPPSNIASTMARSRCVRQRPHQRINLAGRQHPRQGARGARLNHGAGRRRPARVRLTLPRAPLVCVSPVCPRRAVVDLDVKRRSATGQGIRGL